MDRRTFIHSAACLGAATLLPWSCMPKEETSRFKMGYQLYSIRDEMAKNPRATLEALKAMGYGELETYGYDPTTDEIYGMKAAQFKALLDDLELTSHSGHFGFAGVINSSEADFITYTKGCIQGALTLGSKYLTWPWLNAEDRNLDGYQQLAKRLNLAGKLAKEQGLLIAYHNQGYDFHDHQGDNGWDLVLRETDPELVKMQVDMYWVMNAARTTPKKLIAAHPGRYTMWHIKDMDKVTRDYTELGNGSIDYTTVLPDATQSGLEYYYIEQGGNYTVNSLESAQASASYFKDQLQHLIV